jgi:hypothetical protein
MTPAPQSVPLAFSLSEFCRIAKVGRTKVYEDARAGRLRILKNGKRSIVTADEARRYIDNLPRLELPPKPPKHFGPRPTLTGPVG